MTVYVIRVGQYAKIGCTGNLRERLQQIDRRHAGCLYPDDIGPEPGEIVATLRAGADVEAALQDAFADQHVKGEWFRWDDRLERWCQRRQRVMPWLAPPAAEVQF